MKVSVTDLYLVVETQSEKDLMKLALQYYKDHAGLDAAGQTAVIAILQKLDGVPDIS